MTTKKHKATGYTIKIRRQRRKTMMMRAMPNHTEVCIEVFIPNWLDPNSDVVTDFIDKGLAQIGDQVPDVPEEKTSPETVLAMVDEYAKRMNLQPGRVQLRDMTRKWGSCSDRSNITLNKRLCWLSPHLVEYVVCHELAHLIELNHSPAFWAIVKRYMPDYEAREAELRRIEGGLFSKKKSG